MQLALDVTRPYSFAQTLAFVRRFPPCQGDYLVTDDALTAAVTAPAPPRKLRRETMGCPS